MIYPPDFEKRVLDDVRRWTDDIAECSSAELSILWHGQAPSVRFVFGHPMRHGRAGLVVMLVAESLSNPLAPGRLMEGDELRRHVCNSVETYLKANGIQIARKAMMQNAQL